MTKHYSILILGCFISLLSFGQTTSQGFFLDNWQPKTYSNTDYIVTAPTTESATINITVDTKKVISNVSKYLFGHNAHSWGGKYNNSTTFVNDVKNLAPNVIRFPGGSISDTYFWNAKNRDTYPKDLPSTFKYNDIFMGGTDNLNWVMSLNNYYDLLKKTNSTGIISVNYAYARYSTSANPVAAAAHLAAEWVRYDNGRTQFWEIGNENYGKWELGFEIDTKLNKDRQPAIITGDLYGKHCLVFIDSMRKAAAEVNNHRIKIGIVILGEASPRLVEKTWNQGVLSNAASKADFLIVHNYTPIGNVQINSILNYTDNFKKSKEYITSDLLKYGKRDPLPIALTEYNARDTGRSQKTSVMNGVYATLTLGEIIKSGYGLANRWAFLNGWENGNAHSLFATGFEGEGMAQYSPHPTFFYMYYFQKMFGDKVVTSTNTGFESDSIKSYASTFSSGQSGVVVVNKSKKRRTVSLNFSDFTPSSHFEYYLLNGETNVLYSRKVYINGQTTTQSGGGPSNYTSLKPAGVQIVNGKIEFTLPSYGVIFLVVDKNKSVLKPQSISFPAIADKTYGDLDFTPEATSTSGLPITYTSSDTAIATIENGKIHIVSAGSCEIIAEQNGNTAYEPAIKVSRTLTILKKSQTITFPTISSKVYGDPAFPANAFSSSKLLVYYLSSDTSVAKVLNGIITIKSAGETTITVKQSGNTNFLPAIPESQVFNVDKKEQNLNIAFPFDSISVDATVVLDVSSSTEIPIEITSSNELIASVEGTKIVAKSVGIVEFTARQTGTTKYKPASKTVTAKITQKPQVITFPQFARKNVKSENFVTGASVNSPLYLYFTSSNTEVATVLNNVVTIKKAGTTIISAHQNGDELYKKAISVSQLLTVVKLNQTISFETLPIKIDGESDFAPIATVTSGLPIKFKSSNTDVATITATGKIHVIGTGKTTITAMCDSTSVYEIAQNETQELIVKANSLPIVSFESPIDSEIQQPATIVVDINASDLDGQIVDVKLFLNNKQMPASANRKWNTFHLIPDLTNMPIGTHTLKAVATDNLGGVTEISKSITVSSNQISTRIEAESAVLLVGTLRAQNSADFDGTKNLGFIKKDNYANYIINVTKTGVYSTYFRIASFNATSKVEIYKGTTLLGSAMSENTDDWQKYATVKGSDIYLNTLGSQTITVKFVNPTNYAHLLNFNWFELIGNGSVKHSYVDSDSISVISDFEFYPNPAKDFVTIKLSEKPSNITITNSLGLKVYCVTNAKNLISIPTSLIGKKGIYYITVNSVTRKLIIVN